ncbi:hypothetical protein V8C43DRAFT_110036 [Trichoderma afarasin]
MDPFADQNPPILFFPSVYPTYADLGIVPVRVVQQLSSSALQVRSALSHLLANQKPQAAGAAEFGGLRCRSLCSPLSTICGFQSKKPRQLQLTRRSTDHDPFCAVPQLTLDVLLECIQPGIHPVSSIVGQLFAPLPAHNHTVPARAHPGLDITPFLLSAAIQQPAAPLAKELKGGGHPSSPYLHDAPRQSKTNASCYARKGTH